MDYKRQVKTKDTATFCFELVLVLICGRFESWESMENELFIAPGLSRFSGKSRSISRNCGNTAMEKLLMIWYVKSCVPMLPPNQIFLIWRVLLETINGPNKSFPIVTACAR